MSKYLKIFSTILLLTSCILMMFVGSLPDLLPEKSHSDRIVSFWEQQTPDIPLNTTKSESLVNELREYASESAQSEFQKIWFFIERNEQNPTNNYIRRYFLSNTILIRYHHSDFLFPFHFFL